jgi:hypothetical protein
MLPYRYRVVLYPIRYSLCTPRLGLFQASINTYPNPLTRVSFPSPPTWYQERFLFPSSRRRSQAAAAPGFSLPPKPPSLLLTGRISRPRPGLVRLCDRTHDHAQEIKTLPFPPLIDGVLLDAVCAGHTWGAAGHETHSGEFPFLEGSGSSYPSGRQGHGAA